ncbi:PadR family transcriptional regulator [Bacteroidota bacterium]
MSIIDLIILGKIQEQNCSAYELVNILEEQNINKWIKISSQGIYRNINILHEKGYLSGEKVKEGNMPEKTVYSITTQGHRYFQKLMLEISKNFEYFFFNFNAVISNIDKVEKRLALKYLENINISIKNHAAEFNKSYKFHKDKIPYHGKAILDLYYQTFNNVLVPWIKKFISRYNSVNRLSYRIKK